MNFIKTIKLNNTVFNFINNKSNFKYTELKIKPTFKKGSRAANAYVCCIFSRYKCVPRDDKKSRQYDVISAV